VVLLKDVPRQLLHLHHLRVVDGANGQGRAARARLTARLTGITRSQQREEQSKAGSNSGYPRKFLHRFLLTVNDALGSTQISCAANMARRKNIVCFLAEYSTLNEAHNVKYYNIYQ